MNFGGVVRLSSGAMNRWNGLDFADSGVACGDASGEWKPSSVFFRDFAESDFRLDPLRDTDRAFSSAPPYVLRREPVDFGDDGEVSGPL